MASIKKIRWESQPIAGHPRINNTDLLQVTRTPEEYITGGASELRAILDVITCMFSALDLADGIRDPDKFTDLVEIEWVMLSDSLVWLSSTVSSHNNMTNYELFLYQSTLKKEFIRQFG